MEAPCLEVTFPPAPILRALRKESYTCMPSTDSADSTVYNVVINDEEQYSIWPEHREVPAGWRAVGVSGLKAECLDHIENVWTDMRPLSLRKAMANPPKVREKVNDVPQEAIESLPIRLSRQPQPVELILRSERSSDGVIQQLKSRCIHIRFTGTRGGTDLALAISETDAQRYMDQISSGEKRLHITGDLTLDYVPARCVAEIDLSKFAGTAQLNLLTQAG